MTGIRGGRWHSKLHGFMTLSPKRVPCGAVKTEINASDCGERKKYRRGLKVKKFRYKGDRWRRLSGIDYLIIEEGLFFPLCVFDPLFGKFSNLPKHWHKRAEDSRTFWLFWLQLVLFIWNQWTGMARESIVSIKRCSLPDKQRENNRSKAMIYHIHRRKIRAI